MKRNIACSLALLAALNTGMAYADTRICRGSIGSEHIDGDVRVPAGARCKLNGTRVDGNIKLQARARWQLGMIPFLPSAGKLSASFNIGEGTSVSEIINAIELIPIRTSEDGESLPTPTIFGEVGAAMDAESAESAELALSSSLTEEAEDADQTVPVAALPTLPRVPTQQNEDEASAEPTATPAIAEIDEDAAADETAEPTMTATPDLAFRCGNMRHQFETGMNGRLGSIGTSIKVRKEPKTTAEP